MPRDRDKLREDDKKLRPEPPITLKHEGGVQQKQVFWALTVWTKHALRIIKYLPQESFERDLGDW